MSRCCRAMACNCSDRIKEGKCGRGNKLVAKLVKLFKLSSWTPNMGAGAGNPSGGRFAAFPAVNALPYIDNAPAPASDIFVVRATNIRTFQCLLKS